MKFCYLYKHGIAQHIYTVVQIDMYVTNYSRNYMKDDNQPLKRSSIMIFAHETSY